MNARAFLANRSFGRHSTPDAHKQLTAIPVVRRTFDQSAIYRAEAQVLASCRALHGEHMEPSAVDVRDWAMALLVEESKAVAK